MAIIDTAGRLHVDEELMAELVNIRDAVKPHNVLLVVDAMTGQDAVNAADAFKGHVDLDGVVLTKLDGDARGGAALSVRAVTGKPIKFASTGEKLDDFDVFHPDRMASRILGMGDVLSLIEKAEESLDEKQAAEMEAKLRRAEFTFEDFLDQLKQVRKMGSLSSILGMLPGVPGHEGAQERPGRRPAAGPHRGDDLQHDAGRSAGTRTSSTAAAGAASRRAAAPPSRTSTTCSSSTARCRRCSRCSRAAR